MTPEQRRNAKLARRRRRKARHDRPRATNRARVAPDTGDLIAYGATCSWYDTKANVATKPSGLPCCPHCGGVLFETDTYAWNLGVTERRVFAVMAPRPDYPDIVEWLRGRCYPNPIAALAAWLEHKEAAT